LELNGSSFKSTGEELLMIKKPYMLYADSHIGLFLILGPEQHIHLQ
jgi:hypothetical protein